MEKYNSKIEKETNIDIIKRLYKKLEDTEKKILKIKNEQISNLISKNEILTKSLNGVKEKITNQFYGIINLSRYMIKSKPKIFMI